MRHHFKICTVVQGKSIDTFLKNLRIAQATATMVELRVDSIANFNLRYFSVLMKNTKVPSIFTFRNNKKGGLFKGQAITQKEILKTAFEFDFDYVDVSFGNPLLKNLNKKNKKRLLLSYHNAKTTPKIDELKNIVSKMRKLKPAIVKIATQINKTKDIETLNILLSEKNKNEKMIVIGMGEKGKITRVLFPMLGSFITYVTLEGEKGIAPGILYLDELKSSIKILNK